MEYQLKGGAVLFYAASLLIFIFAVSIFTYDMYTESYIKCLTKILFLSKIKDHKPFLYIIFRIISNILHLENIICDVLILKDITTIKKKLKIYWSLEYEEKKSFYRLAVDDNIRWIMVFYYYCFRILRFISVWNVHLYWFSVYIDKVWMQKCPLKSN